MDDCHFFPNVSMDDDHFGFFKKLLKNYFKKKFNHWLQPTTMREFSTSPSFQHNTFISVPSWASLGKSFRQTTPFCVSTPFVG
jgi:hypothetical protein